MKNHKLTILFDAGPIVNGPKSGIGHYTHRLIEALASRHPEELQLYGHYFNFLGRKRPPLPKNSNLHYRVSKIIPGKAQSALRRIGLQIPFDMLLRKRGDIALFPNFVSLPTMRPIKKVVAIHDLGFIYHPQYLQPANLKFLQKFVPLSIKKASKIITISESTKSQLIDNYDVKSDKISVITPAADNDYYYPRSASEVSNIRKKYGLPAKYVLFTSTLEPRKNIEGVLRSYAALDEKIKKAYGLVLAGGKGWEDESILKTINELRAAGENIITTGYVPDEDLPAIYSGAALFVYPSFYEGFGIPPLEAMACGVPVISADNTSLPEVVGNAGLYVKAEDTAGLTLLIEQVLANPKLAKELRQKGFKQAKKFSWQESAQQLFNLLEELK